MARRAAIARLTRELAGGRERTNDTPSCPLSLIPQGRETDTALRVLRQLLVGACLAVLAAAVVLTAIQDGGYGDPSPEERFAENVCSTILPRAQELLDTYDSVVHERAAPGPDARVALWALALRGKETTWELRNEVRALSVPDTDAGRLAAAYVKNDAGFALEGMSEEERRARRLPESITLLQSIRGLDRLEQALSSAWAAVLNYDIIGATVPELKEPFENADSCKELEALRTNGGERRG